MEVGSETLLRAREVESSSSQTTTLHPSPSSLYFDWEIQRDQVAKLCLAFLEESGYDLSSEVLKKEIELRTLGCNLSLSIPPPGRLIRLLFRGIDVSFRNRYVHFYVCIASRQLSSHVILSYGLETVEGKEEAAKINPLAEDLFADLPPDVREGAHKTAPKVSDEDQAVGDTKLDVLGTSSSPSLNGGVSVEEKDASLSIEVQTGLTSQVESDGGVVSPANGVATNIEQAVSLKRRRVADQDDDADRSMAELERRRARERAWEQSRSLSDLFDSDIAKQIVAESTMGVNDDMYNDVGGGASRRYSWQSQRSWDRDSNHERLSTSPAHRLPDGTARTSERIWGDVPTRRERPGDDDGWERVKPAAGPGSGGWERGRWRGGSGSDRGGRRFSRRSFQERPPK